MHFHWGEDSQHGSEHTIDGKQFPLELHLVHHKEEYGSLSNATNYKDGVVVVGVFFHLQHSNNPYLKDIIDLVEKVKEEETMTYTGTKKISPNTLLPFIRTFAEYQGSLTTPPCSQAVDWHVLLNSVGISQAQLNAFHEINTEPGTPLKKNYRPVQPLNGRKVYKSAIFV
jgi:carbonic anhydrase